MSSFSSFPSDRDSSLTALNITQHPGATPVHAKVYGSTTKKNDSDSIPCPSPTEQHISNVHQEPTSKPIDKSSLYVLYGLTVITEAARGLLLPSIWPYFSSLGGSKQGLGALIGIYSLGRMLSVIPLGHISDEVSSNVVLIASSLIQAFGHGLYAVSPGTKALYLSRIIVGFGSASTSVARAHVTKAVPHDRRTHHLAYLSGLQFVGFAVLPAFGSLFAILPHTQPLPFLKLNGFTNPAFFLVVANIACALLVMGFYSSPPEYRPVSCPKTMSQDNGLECISPSFSRPSVMSSSSKMDVFICKPDWVALAICLMINLVFRGVLAQLETVSIPFLMEEFGINYKTASIWMTMIGILGVGIYFSFKPVSKWFSDRSLVAAGLLFIAVGCFPLCYSSHVSHMNIFTYMFLLSLTWSVAYPIGQTAILALFSKVVGRVNIGCFMGLFSASGALSPLILSVVSSKLWETYGRESVFSFIVTIIFTAGLLMLCTYRRLSVESSIRSI